MGSIDSSNNFDFDVIIVGAGISGINAAYRIQTQLPNYSYTILESRNALGGTWDLFRYPGIRSDSDLHTFGFPWNPWTEGKAIADGESIRNYMRDSAEKFGIDQKIQYHHKLISADWSTPSQQWNLSVDSNGKKQKYTARFVILSTGYYNYSKPLEAHIPGLANFSGQIIHPQFWPSDLDYTSKRIIIIGSGATAITLLPNLAAKASHITMLQRSPSYILSLPNRANSPSFTYLPQWLSLIITRWKFLVFPFIFFKFCHFFPNAARFLLRKNVERQLPSSMSHDPNFNPRYNPWEQRMCVCPDGDFFKPIREGKADIVTDIISTVTETGIETKGGKILEADIIVTATGLKMQTAGGARITVDSQPVPYASKFLWKGIMLQDVPNMAVVIGYTNASWTLGADITAQTVCSLLKRMQKTGKSSVVARVGEGEKIEERQLLNLNSTYIEKAKGELPKAGDRGVWLPRGDYLWDYWASVFGTLNKGLEFSGGGGKKVN